MNIKKTVIDIVFLLISFLLQFSVPVRIFGVAPNWLLCYAVVLSLSENTPVRAVIYSLLAGALADFGSGIFFGHQIFWFVVLAYLSVFLVEQLFTLNFGTVVVTFSAAFLLIKLSYYFLNLFFGNGFSFVDALWRDMLPSFLVSLLPLLLYFIFYFIFYFENKNVRFSRRRRFRR